MEKVVLKISISEDGNSYNIHSDQGMSVNDVLHGMSCVVKALARDKLIANTGDAFQTMRSMCDKESEVEDADNP